MKLELLVISLMVLLIYGDENTATTTTTSTTQSSSTSTLSSSTTQVSTTTQATTSSTNVPNAENATKPVKLPSNRTQLLNTTNYACSCDLTLSCDINCCCDIDCSDGILQAFRCDDGVQIDDYRYGEGLERCEIDNGLFCIFRDSLGSPDYYIKAPIYPEYSTYRWPEKSSSIALEPRRKDVRDFYKYGDEITAFNKINKKHETIKIPASLTGSACYFSQPVTFLKSKSVKCLKSLNELCTYNNKLILQLVNSQLFRRPSKMLETQEASDVFSINVQSCQHTSGNCTKILISEDGAEELELLGEDVFDEIQMEFVINDTSITSLTVKFFSHEDLVCGIEELGHTNVIQTIDVRFINVNGYREKLTRKYSRGYNDEELILASRLRPLNESAVDEGMALDYYRNDTCPETDFYMKIPDSRKGRCVLNSNIYDSIRFNEHSITMCTVELARDEKLNETCQQFQRQIVYFLFNTMNLTSNYTQDNFASDVFVSQFWSPRNHLLAWKRVVVQNVPAWYPEQHETDKFLICSSLPTFIRYSFFSSRVRSSAAKKYENVIEKVVVKFEYAVEMKFPIDSENHTATADIEIQVQFFNLHEIMSSSLRMSLNDLIIFFVIFLMYLI